MKTRQKRWKMGNKRWKMGNNKKIPTIIRIMIAEKSTKTFHFAPNCFPFSNALLLNTINQTSVKKNILTLRGACVFFIVRKGAKDKNGNTLPH